MSGHLTLDDLRELVWGHRSEDKAELLEHCRTCVECGDNLAALLAATSAKTSRSAGDKGKKYLWVGAMAATLVLVLAAVILSRTVFVDPGSAVERELAALATTETIPGIAVQFHVRLSESEPVAIGREVPLIREGGELLAAGEYDAAIIALERDNSALPESRLASTYLGIARYLSGDDSPEVAQLLAAGVGTADTRTPASIYAEWYLGNYLLRVGRVDEAVVVLEMVADLEGRLGREALATLEAIRRVRER